MQMMVLTLLALHANSLMDSEIEMTIDEVQELINNRTLFDAVQQRINSEGALMANVLTTLDPDGKAELLDALGRVVNAVDQHKVGIGNPDHGLLYLNAILIELVQQNVDTVTLR